MDDIPDMKNHIATLISDLRDNLNRISAQSEQGFLDLGSLLQKATQEGKTITQNVSEIIALAEGHLGKEALGKIDHLARLASDYFNVQQDWIGRKSLMIKTLTGHLDRLREKNLEIEKMAKYLRAVALNMFIETSRSQALNDHFSIIANEIKVLSGEILSLSASVRESVGESKNRFDTMEMGIREGIRDLEHLTGKARDSFAYAIRQVDEWLRGANAVAQQKVHLQMQIQEKIGDIVMALQFQDAMRQRLEHIIASLSEMDGMAGALDGDTDESRDTLSMMFEFTCLLYDQMDAIIREAEGVSVQCFHAFVAIEENMVAIENDMENMVTQDDPGSDSAESPKTFAGTGFVHSLREFLSVKTSGDDLASRMNDIYRMTSDISVSLEKQVGQIHQISMDTHIKSLNAMIAAAHLWQEGRTLSVLAVEMKGLSDVTDRFVVDINGILTDLVSDARLKDHDGDRQDADDYGKTLEEMAQTVPHAISELITTFSELKTNMDAVRKTQDRIRETVTFIPDLARDLEERQGDLNQLKRHLSPYYRQDGEGFNIHSRIEERYTMEKERSAHRKSVEHLAGGTGAGQGPSMEEDLGDNIELF